MSLTADEVVVVLDARMQKYEADLQRARQAFDRSVGAQEARMAQFDRQMKASAGSISGSLRGVAAAFATAFTGRELVGLLDNFTRLQNQLKVAGLEGDELKRVQDALFASVQKNGVAINTLAELYGKAASAQKDLGASQAQLLKLTDLTAKSLLITGTSTAQASGAILGLAQALGNAKLQAEEFNQINEGGLRPLLQAAAAGERFGGSVSKLRQAVIDGKLTSQEFFKAILDGADQLENKAAKATLTLSAGFNTLSNALTVYFGEADKANGVSAALGETLGAIADNLDTLIPALAVVTAAIGVRYVAGATAAAGATLLASNAVFALQARMAGAATTAEALTVAMGGMSKAGVATGIILALGAAVLYANHRVSELSEATGEYAKLESAAKAVREKAADAAGKLATATGKAAEEARKNAAATREEAQALLATARAALITAQAKAKAAAIEAKASPLSAPGPIAGPFRAAGAIFGVGPLAGNARAQANLAAAQQAEKDAQAAVDAFNKPGSIALPSVSGGKGGGGRGGAGGPSPADIARRFNDELAGLVERTNSAYASVATSAEQRAELEERNVELARIRTRDGISAAKDYSDAQKKQLTEQVEFLAQAERDRIDFDRRNQLEQEAQQLADRRFQTEREALQQQLDLADSSADRRRIALALVDAEEKHLRATLEAIRDSSTASEAEKRAAAIDLERVGILSEGRREDARRGTESPLEAYRRRLNRSPNAINDDVEGFVVDELQAVQNGIASALGKAIGTKDPLITSLINLLIEQLLIRPMVEALAGAQGLGGGGGIGGLFGTLLGGLFGGLFADGGRPPLGRISIVGERGPEFFVPDRPGIIVPNHTLNVPQVALMGRGGASTVQQTIMVDARGAVMNDQFASMILGQAQSYAAQAGQAAYQGAVRDTPVIMAKRQRYG